MTMPDFSRRQCPALVPGRSTGPLATWPLEKMVSVLFKVSFGVQPPIGEKHVIQKSSKVKIMNDNVKCQSSLWIHILNKLDNLISTELDNS